MSLQEWVHGSAGLAEEGGRAGALWLECCRTLWNGYATCFANQTPILALTTLGGQRSHHGPDHVSAWLKQCP